MHQSVRAAGLAAAMAAFASAAAAQDPGLPQSDDVLVPQRQFVIDLGLGASVGPRYDGADEYLIQPVPIIGFSRLTLPGIGEVGGGDPKRGVFVFPTFDYIGSRDPSDSRDLQGTKDVDWALAVGLGAGYRYDFWRVFVQADYGFNGYSGFRGTIGADVIGAPAPRATLSFGPRLSWAGDDYMDTYFSVSDSEAAKSGGRLKSYSADGGLRALGVAVNGSYALTDSVFLLGNARYDLLIGDAGDSPIVKAGDDNQFTFGLGISYRFSFDVFEQ
jgi:outer membrane scaffolding protein for murein synthesis (MipA/OmpV family)